MDSVLHCTMAGFLSDIIGIIFGAGLAAGIGLWTRYPIRKRTAKDRFLADLTDMEFTLKEKDESVKCQEFHMKRLEPIRKAIVGVTPYLSARERESSTQAWKSYQPQDPEELPEGR